MNYILLIFITVFIISTFFALLCGEESGGMFSSWTPQPVGCLFSLISLLILLSLGFMVLGEWLL